MIIENKEKISWCEKTAGVWMILEAIIASRPYQKTGDFICCEIYELREFPRCRDIVSNCVLEFRGNFIELDSKGRFLHIHAEVPHFS